jgi:hypothetical protein
VAPATLKYAGSKRPHSQVGGSLAAAAAAAPSEPSSSAGAAAPAAAKGHSATKGASSFSERPIEECPLYKLRTGPSNPFTEEHKKVLKQWGICFNCKEGRHKAVQCPKKAKQA